MDVTKFDASPIGNLTPISGTDKTSGASFHHFAYVPHPLGAEPALSNSTWRAVSRASHALGRLQQGSAIVKNPSILRQPTLRREAQSTSALEGTFAPLEEVLAANVIDQSNRSSALREVLNYVQAAEVAFESLEQGRRITVGLIEQLHADLVAGTAADTDDAGRTRSIQVAIGTQGRGVEQARFIPMPPGATLRAAFGDLIDWVRRSDESADGRDPLVAAAMAHYQFETIHPFNDGNGRLGRLLIVLQLLQDHALSEPLLSVSPWFEARRDKYQDALAEVSVTGDWNPWVTFFAEGLEASAVDTATRLESLLAVQEHFHDVLRGAKARGIVRDIVDHLIGLPFVNIRNLADLTGATYQAASTAAGKLVDLGILEEMTTQGVRAFRAPLVLAAILRR
ncbi:Fic/DOC family N-terminal domain-containing protein [Herbiconiux sp. KACC 21604]|uniref:Fic family protein n=1 Tax=unclassified Herbiconiux TaxID=2618217 RepID=UPI001492905E|nr:Fic/DOC family N-terminal domain-containing protein [Herbiconiux sp. SALV-R1]QJU55774.1 Fic family protein [Herbiconiux sp. SALV-R1]WPO86983.1 Fic/DOC family N-terminal domain-containing protein [Herbiconiux sp. KACC 21604]